MCRFISIAVEDTEVAKSIFAGYNVWDNENKSFKSEIPPQYHPLWVTDGHCSCGFYSEPYDPEYESQKLRKKFSKPKYKKKGWSQERIEREIEHIMRKQKEKGGLSSLLFSCIEAYTKNAGSCYFHIGWYSGDQTKQGLNIADRKKVTLSSGSITESEVNENTLYEFT
jgi:hypothetical protein